jgi:glucose-inhibited division protein A
VPSNSNSLFQQAVDDLVIQGDRIHGVITQSGLRFDAAAVVLTAGTFLAGKIHVGLSNHPGGRAGDPPATTLAMRLREGPFVVDRLKTGTPPRIDGRSIDYSQLAEQAGTSRFHFQLHRLGGRPPAQSVLDHPPASARTRSSAAAWIARRCIRA